MTAHAASHVYFGVDPMWVSTCVLAITYATLAQSVGLDSYLMLIPGHCFAVIKLPGGGLHDPEFGPMLMIGLGGIFVEILHDTSYRLVPAAINELHAMIREVKGYSLLAGVRGNTAVDENALIHTLQAVAWVLTDFPEIVELDLNPVLAGPDGAIVADGRAILVERKSSVERGASYGK